VLGGGKREDITRLKEEKTRSSKRLEKEVWSKKLTRQQRENKRKKKRQPTKRVGKKLKKARAP